MEAEYHVAIISVTWCAPVSRHTNKKWILDLHLPSLGWNKLNLDLSFLYDLILFQINSNTSLSFKLRTVIKIITALNIIIANISIKLLMGTQKQ